MLTFLMLLLVVLVIVFRLKQNQAGMIACAAVALVLVIVRATAPLWSSTPAEQNIFRAREVMAYGLAEKIAERHPEGKVIVLGVPESVSENLVNEGYIDIAARLTKFLNRKGLEVESLPFPSNQEVTEGFLDEQVALLVQDGFSPEIARSVVVEEVETDIEPLTQFLLGVNDHVNAVIITVPLPFEMVAEDLPGKGTAPNLVLLIQPNWKDLDYALEATALDTVLTFRPNASKLVAKKWPKSNEEAFVQRYKLLTAESSSP